MDRFEIAKESTKRAEIASLVQRLKELEAIPNRTAEQNEEIAKCSDRLWVLKPRIKYDVISY